MLHDKQLQILKYLNDENAKGNSSELIMDKAIAKSLNIGLQEIQDRLEMLEMEGKIILAKAGGPTFSAIPTAEGRMEIRHLTEASSGTQNSMKRKLWSWIVSFEQQSGILIRSLKNIYFLLGVVMIFILIIYAIFM